MSEDQNKTTTTSTEPAATTPTTGPTEVKAYTAPATQADLDRIVENRLAREREKFADYDDLKTRAAKWDEAEAANKTELQRAQEAAAAADKRANDAEAKVLRAEVAAAKGVPAALLTGSTKADLEAAADALLAFRGDVENAPPAEGEGGDVHKGGEQSPADTVTAALGR